MFRVTLKKQKSLFFSLSSLKVKYYYCNIAVSWSADVHIFIARLFFQNLVARNFKLDNESTCLPHPFKFHKKSATFSIEKNFTKQLTIDKYRK